MTGILAAAVDNWVALAISVGLLVFLTVALLFPERF
jgi:K+-transporting ATPase KdpF subunit